MTRTKKKVQTSKDRNKLFRDIMRIDFLQDEIEYATKQLQPHDTGHINTAISWLQHRVRQLKGQTDD